MNKEKKPRGIRKPKDYTPGDTNKNSYIASYGNISGGAARFYEDSKEFLDLIKASVKIGDNEDLISVNAYDNPGMTPFGARAKHSDEMPKELGERIAFHLLCALKTQNGKFFRDIAELCEWGKDFDALKFWLIQVHFTSSESFNSGKQDKFYTAKELVAKCEQVEKNSGWKVLSGKLESKEKAIWRACKKLGIKITALKKPN